MLLRRTKEQTEKRKATRERIRAAKQEEIERIKRIREERTLRQASTPQENTLRSNDNGNRSDQI